MQVERASRNKLYEEFLGVIEEQFSKEQGQIHRQMFWVLIWCFVIPALLYSVLLLMIRFGYISPSNRSNLDWLILVFPVMYSLFFMGSELRKELPRIFKRGGVSSTLEEAARQSRWRVDVMEAFKKKVSADPDDWDWIYKNFQLDLDRILYRVRHMTALAGATLFLLLEGLDFLTSEGGGLQPTAQGLIHWIQGVSGNFVEMLALILFLVLFYISGTQVYYSMERYLGALALLKDQFKKR